MSTIKHQRQRRTLLWVLVINLGFFVTEMTYGLLSGSLGLVADSLDMLGDAFVYGLALLVVGGTLASQQRVARASSLVEMSIAGLGIFEALRRFIFPTEPPDFVPMIVVSTLALLGNVACLYLLRRDRSGEVHMRASYIFTSNDVIVNAGVITAGVLVYFTASRWPDLIIGIVIFAVVLRGAYRIYQLSQRSQG